LILVDANLLLYAYHPRAEQHEKSRAWLEAVLSGPDLVRFAWLTLWAFFRIATNPRVFERPLHTSEAEAAVSSWLAQPTAGRVGRTNFRPLNLNIVHKFRDKYAQPTAANAAARATLGTAGVQLCWWW